ncbi:hypothetical protein ZPR_2480 [Zunongwangia profunda SM-A87]|uniref:Uncharacterized protein n=1 Tax=Zunongwangia profunda (strain DSM 18752 / CCTCC AB 206139 / SM-A87) TaxID=655815 RepID=D5BE45_ZUNPS|nr:hypothetical protein ZPR_2480 [Zunongwangia profunda SM-A87]
MELKKNTEFLRAKVPKTKHWKKSTLKVYKNNVLKNTIFSYS